MYSKEFRSHSDTKYQCFTVVYIIPHLPPMCDRNNLHILGSNHSGTQILSAWVWKPSGENLNATASQ